MKKICLALALSAMSAILPIAAQHSICVVDSTDSTPVAGATFFSSSGLIVGMSDDNGRLAHVATSEFPLTIDCLGYRTATVLADCDTICLSPTVYTLRDVSVSPGERPVMCVVSYVREYTTGASSTDTLQLFSEYMIETFNTISSKVKGYDKSHAAPRILASNNYGRHIGPDSVCVRRMSSDETISLMAVIVRTPSEEVVLPESITDVSWTDTVMGKHFPRSISRRSPTLFSVREDLLCDKKDHRVSPWLFKLFGLTMDVTEARRLTAYSANERNVYGINDLVYSTYNIHIIGRGKWIRKAFHSDSEVTLDSYIEVYPVEVTYLTVEDYKDRIKNPASMDITESVSARPLQPFARTIIEQLNTDE